MKTNNKKTAFLTFHDLWNNHPTITGDDYPCYKEKFKDQCAIKMGICLNRLGVDTSKLSGVTHCYFGEHKGKGHTLRAEELAKGLADYPLAGLGPLTKIHHSDFATGLNGKTGIIFFKDYWRRKRKENGKIVFREKFRNRSGDHIDLWNGSRLTDWFTWVRIYVRLGNVGVHTFYDDLSDFQDSKQIWFWQVS